MTTSKGYHVCIDGVAAGRLERIAAEMGRKVEDLIEIAAEEAALEYAKSRGWPVLPLTVVPKAYECPSCGVHNPSAYLDCHRAGCPDGRDPR